MSSKLFAFQVAKPIEKSTEETFNGLYDPMKQTTVWQGDVHPVALYCSYSPGPYGATGCNIHMGRCYLTGNSNGPYFCD